MPKGDLTTKVGKWSRAGHPCCVGCGTTEIPHMAKGLCTRCYSNSLYHQNIETKKRQRKIQRLRAPIEKAQSDYEREKRWKAENRERALASQKAHYEKNKHLINRWPIGAAVEVKVSCWVRGKIVKRINNLKVRVQLHNGRKVDVGTRSGKKIRRLWEPSKGMAVQFEVIAGVWSTGVIVAVDKATCKVKSDTTGNVLEIAREHLTEREAA